MSAEAKTAKLHSPNDARRLIVAAVIPLAAFGLQWVFWPAIQPYVWFLFFPAVFLSSWAGGLWGGLVATALSGGLAWYFFMPPQFSFAVQRHVDLVSIGIFVSMGVLFSLFHGRLRKANQQVTGALAAVRSANDQLEGQILKRTAELEQTNLVLRESEERFRTMIESIVEYAIIMLDAGGHVVSWNAGAERMKGYRADEIIGQHLSRFYCKEDVESGKPERNLAFTAAEGYFEDEDWRVRKDGARFMANVVITALRDETGQLRGYANIVRDITNRKRMEERMLLQSSALESAANAILITDCHGRIEWTNPAFTRLTGYAATEVIGRNPREFIKSGKHDASFFKNLWVTILAGRTWQGETINRRKDGTMFTEFQTITPVRDARGQISHFIAIKEDVTERKKAEEALRSSQLLIEEIINTIPARIFWKNKNLDYLGCNAAFARDAGFVAPKDLLGKDDYQMAWRDQAELYRNDDRQVVESGRPKLLIEEPQTTPDGNTITLLTSKVPLRSSNGQIIGVLGMYMDISDRKKAEEALRTLNADLERRVEERTAELRASEARYRTLFRSTDEGFCIVEMIFDDHGKPVDYRFLEVNPAFESQTGLRDAVGKTMRELAPDHKEHWFETYGRIAMEGGAIRFQNHAEQLNRDYDVYACRIGEPEDRQVAILFHDITERKQFEEKLITAREAAESANRAKSEFLAMMSHELRTPLNGILGMNDLLLNTALTERQRRFVEACSTSGKALLQQINDVLDLSKIEAGRLELDVHPCNLESLVFDIVDVFNHSAAQKRLLLKCQMETAVCVKVLGDEARLRQVLLNLLGNALKFTASGGVTVGVEAKQQVDRQLTIRFSVTDTGPGVPEDQRDRLFSPFSQGDSSTTRRFGGTGLGLSVSKQLVELMGGRIGFESQVGVGSTFWFEVPLPLADGDAKVASQQQIFSGIRVLAVDGIDKAREQIGECLRCWGCLTEVVATVREALDAVRRAKENGTPFAVVLADCRLAEGDEYVLLTQLSTDPHLPIIGLGAAEDEESVAYLRQLGVHHVLRDPARPSLLYDAMSSVLSIKSQPGSRDVATGKPRGEPHALLSGQVLVAEDNRINQMYIIELLKFFGCTCDLAANGREAVQAVRQKRYDLALMDCQMPSMDGFAATGEIRRWEADEKRPGHLPIVALTANALKGDRERCLEAGMDDYLSKPIERAQLRAMLEKYLASQTKN